MDNSLLDDLELLKGDKIGLLDPWEIPCNEICDPVIFKSNPLVSVVVITYNHQKFIRKAIEGIINQKTTFEFELIVSDDCSSDQTLQIIEGYQKKFPKLIRILFSHINVGISANALRSDLRTRGKYIAYCEGDDFWIDPYKLQKQALIMESDQELGLLFTDAKKYFDELDKYENQEKNILSAGLHKKNEYFIKRLYSSIPITTCTIMVRQSNILTAIKNNIVLSINSSMMDMPRWYAASKSMKTYFLPDVTAVYVIHRSSVSNNWDLNQAARQGCLVTYGFACIELSHFELSLILPSIFYRMISHAFYNNDKDLAIACKNLAKKRNVKLTYFSKIKLSTINLPFLYDILNFFLELSRKLKD